MSRCSSCGADPGFPISICPNCGARPGSDSERAVPSDGRTVLVSDATIGPSGVAGRAIGCFLVIDGPDRGEKFLIESTGLVGRGRDSTVTLNDPRISTRHAHVKVQQGRIIYQDLEATNGSYLRIAGSKRRIRGPHVVSDGDEITLGSTVLRYVELNKGEGR